ncbi:MAG: sugar ABC transporter permease [Lachnospiraceae bacterium]
MGLSKNSKRKCAVGGYKKKHSMIGMAFSIPIVIFLLVFVLYPVVYNIWLSFTNASLMKGTSEFVGIDNYVRIFSNKLFKKYFWNTCVWTFWSVLGQLLLGLGLALLISRPMRGGTALRSFLLIPYVVPAVALALVTKWIMNSDYGIVSYWLQQAGLLDGRQSLLALQGPAMWVVILLNIWRSYPFPMLIYWAALKGIDREIMEAAAVDGASKWKIFRYITLPELKNTTIVLAVLRVIWTATYYDLIYMVTGGGPAGSTTHLPILIYQSSFGSFQIGYASAISMILGALMFICIIFYVAKSDIADS